MKFHIANNNQRTLFATIIGFVYIILVGTATAGLDTWLEPLDDATIRDSRNGSIWQLDRSNWLKSEQEVKIYLDTLNTGKYNDWRLPTKSEMYSFVNIFDWEKNGEVNIKIDGNHWIIDDANQVAAVEWELEDMCGPERRFYNKKSGYVRAIRP